MNDGDGGGGDDDDDDDDDEDLHSCRARIYVHAATVCCMCFQKKNEKSLAQSEQT